MKALMAITGLVMIGFLLMHMFGNLKVFLGADEYNHYAGWLKGATEDGGLAAPILPAGWFLWLFRAVLLVAIVLHMYSAWVLTQRAHDARSAKYVNNKRVQQTYASRTMRWGGVILATILVFHILQFTAQVVRTGFDTGATPYDMVVASFSQWWLVLLYAVWVFVVTLHIRHGFWSALATLGAHTSPRARSLLNTLAWIVAVLLFVGFMVMPVGILFGIGR